MEQTHITIHRVEFVKPDFKLMRRIIRRLIVNGTTTNGDVKKAMEREFGRRLKSYQRIDPVAIQNAFSYFRFSKQQQSFRDKYNFK